MNDSWDYLLVCLLNVFLFEGMHFVFYLKGFYYFMLIISCVRVC